MNNQEMDFFKDVYSSRKNSITGPMDILTNLLEPDTHILLYGAGAKGRMIYSYLSELARLPEAFLDKNAGLDDSFNGVPIYQPDSEKITLDQKKNGTVFITPLLSVEETDSVIFKLKSLGFQNIVYSPDLTAYCQLDALGWQMPCEVDISKVCQAYSIMEDVESRRIFKRNFEAHCTQSYGNTLTKNPEPQYFLPSMELHYQCFADCGAFTGDTYLDLLKQKNCHHYFGFEPDLRNFQTLCQTISDSQHHFDSIITFPIALSDENSVVHFNADGSSSSSISKDAVTGQYVTTAKLDDILHHYPVSYIKMDIEGAELSALKGAESIISSRKPDLAICVYHKFADIWEIPLFLHLLVPEYKFYLRSHASLTFETVLYAKV